MAAQVEDHELNLLPPADLAGEIERLQEELHNEHDRYEVVAMVAVPYEEVNSALSKEMIC